MSSFDQWVRFFFFRGKAGGGGGVNLVRSNSCKLKKFPHCHEMQHMCFGYLRAEGQMHVKMHHISSLWINIR